jgi:recombination protein RecT
MSNEVTTATNKPVRLIDEWRDSVNRMSDQFKMALPAHIPVERFIRVVLTALQNNQKLMACTKQSFFNAAVRCAQDGLLPDGREAAIVPFGEEDAEDGRGRTRSDMAGYMPMVAGIRKKVRNSGEIKDWNAAVVYQGEPFEFELGDEPFIRHKKMRGGRVGRQIEWAYSVVTFKDDTKSRDVMPIEEIEDIRKKFSRSKKGPWSVPESYPEMCIKTVVKHHAKSLPMSTDLDRLLHADDALYDFRGAADKQERVAPPPRPTSLQNAFDVFAADEPVDKQNESLKSEADAAAPQNESETESSTNQEHATAETNTAPREAAASDSAAGAATDPSPDAAPTNQLFTDPIEAARQRGIADRKRGVQKRAVPPEYRDRQAVATAWQRGWEGDN